MSKAGAQAPTTATGTNAAKVHFDRGTAFYASRNYEDALLEFRASFQISDSPNARLAVARCLRELGRAADAVREYEATITLANERSAQQPAYAQTRDTARAELLPISAKVARLRVEVRDAPAGVRVRINGQEVSDASLLHSWAVTPGVVVLDVDAPERESHHQEVAAAAGQDVRVSVTLAKLGTIIPTEADDAPAPGPVLTPGPADAASDGSTLSTAGWVAAGVGVAGVVSFVVFYVLAEGHHDDVVAQCVDRTCSAAKEDSLASTGETYQTLTNVSLGVGIVGLLTGAAFLIFDATSGDGSAQTAAVARRRGPVLRVSGTDASLTFRF